MKHIFSAIFDFESRLYRASFGGGAAPSAPPPSPAPPPPPSSATTQVKQTMRAMQRRRGFGSTLLANNAGLTTLDAARKTILGG